MLVITLGSGDEQERALAESREKARRDLVAMYDTGREEGLEEGIQLGEDNARRRIAHSMLDLGIPEDKILVVTGISKEQLAKLKDSI